MLKLEYISLLLDQLHLSVRGVDTWVPIHCGIGISFVIVCEIDSFVTP